MSPPLFSIALLAGMSLLFLMPRLPSLPESMAALLCVVAVYLMWRGVWTAVAAVLVGGFLWAALIAQHGLNSRLPFEAGRIDSQVEGTVTGLVRASGTTLSFRFETHLSPDPGPVRIDLRWYEFPADTQQPVPGDIWRLSVRLRAARGSANPGLGFWEDYAFRNGIAASGYVRPGDNRLVGTRYIRGTVAKLRNGLSHELIDVLSAYETAPLIVALAVGDRQHLTQDHWQILRRTGLSHLVAISGLHIGIVAGLAYALVGAIAGGFTERQGIAMACLLSMVLALSYAALAGFTIPTQRALIVVFVLLAARWTRRCVRPVHALSVALSGILLLDPKSVLDAGFWLSFAAVAVILYSSAGQLSEQGRAGLSNLWRMQLAVLIGLSPLMIILFGQISLAAPLVNFALLPLFSMLLVPAVLGGVVAFLVHQQTGVVILRFAARLLDLLWPVLADISQLELLLRPATAPGVIAIALAVAGALWLLAPRGWPARGLGAICLLPALMSPAQRPAPGSFDLTVLDVGQGLSAVIRTHRHVLVFDTGPKWGNGSDAASRIVIPYLHRSGHRRIDRLVVSHGDADHSGGLQTLIDHYPDASILASGVAEMDSCLQGQRWFWDGIAFDVLHPPGNGLWSGNSASCVLRVSDGRNCLLLTGDIEADAEIALAHDTENALNCAVVLAPHHGSKTSSTQEFVTATRARFVIVSAGYTNPWGFPRPAVVNRWQRSGAMVLNTARSGAISARFGADGVIVLRRHRCENQRFWRPACSTNQSESAPEN